MSGPRIAVVGATGAVGQELLGLLVERSFPLGELTLFGSPRSAGRVLSVGGRSCTVQALKPGVERAPGVERGAFDFALFAANGDIARAYAPRFAASGATVIDNSSAFRRDATVPLVVPEVNAKALAGHQRVIANPNCSTILLALALAPLQRAVGLRRVIVSTYQAASGAGQAAVTELHAATSARLAGRRPPPAIALPGSLGFNLFPHVDRFEPDGYTREEDKMLFEMRKILGLPDLPVEATCVRVPVERCHAESVTVELNAPLSPAAARDLFAAAPGLAVIDAPEVARYPVPDDLTGCDPVAVGRIRRSRAFGQGLTFWLVGDQLRKGAALNALQIAETLIGHTSPDAASLG